ncbi:MAG: hypothetical protein JW395_0335 [Nitrospira sp.]|nr:hypothetical protein [Nitrospira sp.]
MSRKLVDIYNLTTDREERVSASVLNLLYLLSAKLAPSPAPARVSDGVVRDV